MVDSAWTKLTRYLLVWSWLIAASLAHWSMLLETVSHFCSYWGFVRFPWNLGALLLSLSSPMKVSCEIVCCLRHLVRPLLICYWNSWTGYSARHEISQAVLLGENSKAMEISYESVDVFPERWSCGRNNYCQAINVEPLLTTWGGWGNVPKKMSMWEKMWIPGSTDLGQCFTTWERWQSSDGRVPRMMNMGGKRECSMRLTLNVVWLGNAEKLRSIWSNLLISTCLRRFSIQSPW